MYVFYFSLQLLSETSLILRIIQWVITWFLLWHNFHNKFFFKSSNIKLHENPSSGSGVVPCRQTNRWTDGYDLASSPFSQFCKCTEKLGWIHHLQWVNNKYTKLFPLAIRLLQFKSSQNCVCVCVYVSVGVYVYIHVHMPHTHCLKYASKLYVYGR